MNTKAIGDITEAMVLATLLRMGKVVLQPFGDNQRYDLVIEEEDGSFVRVQCKTGRLKNGTVKFATSNQYSHRGRPRRDYRGSADLFGVYCPETGRVYLVPVMEVGTSMACLRVDPAKNGQVDNVRLASHYEIG